MTNSQKRRTLDASTMCDATISRIIEMAWEDRTAFEAIEAQFGLNESAVIDLMRKHMKPSSFRMWRKRVSGRRTKHAVLRGAVFFVIAPSTHACDAVAHPHSIGEDLNRLPEVGPHFDTKPSAGAFRRIRL